MKERPILFSGPMVLAILEGRKTQTRRIVKPQPQSGATALAYEPGKPVAVYALRDGKYSVRCPYGQPGDRLWVRETWQHVPGIGTCYRAEDRPGAIKTPWKPSIFMRREDSRIILDVVGVRCERLHAIGRDGRKAHDVLAEGITEREIELWREYLHPDDAPAHTYGVLWESINGKGSWAANPWVWVVEFKRVE